MSDIPCGEPSKADFEWVRMETDKIRKEAMEAYRALVGRYGLQWTPRNVPDQAAWDRMAEINKVLTTEDRREALGFPNVRSSSFR